MSQLLHVESSLIITQAFPYCCARALGVSIVYKRLRVNEETSPDSRTRLLETGLFSVS